MIRLLSVSEVAKALDVTDAVVYKLTREGRLAYYKVPGGRKVGEDDLDAFIRSTRVERKEAVHA